MKTTKIRHAITSRRWWAAAGIRAVKTSAQTTVALIGTTAVGLLDVDWAALGSMAGMAGVVSLLTSLAGLPELPDTDGAEVAVGGQ